MTELLPGVRQDLEALVGIPSVSLDSFDQQQVEDSANAVAALLRAEGLDVEIVREGGRPAVIGHRDGPPGSPTVTLYAHHDVQPPGDDALGLAVRTHRAGRASLRAWRRRRQGRHHGAPRRAAEFPDGPPVGVVVFVEGEEEIGSESLVEILLQSRPTSRPTSS